MALVDLHYAYVTFGDSRKKTSTIQVRVSSVDAAAYFGAATQILKDGTAVGQLLLSFEDMSAGTMIAKGVKLETIDDAAAFPAPDDNVYAFDKLMIHYQSGIRNYHVTIPARDDTAYTVAADGVTVILDGDQQVIDLVTRFNATVLPAWPATAAPSVYLMEVSS